MRITPISERDHVILFENFLTAEACAGLIAFCESKAFEEAGIHTDRGAIMVKDVRNNDRLFWDDAVLARSWWERAASTLPRQLGEWRAVGFNERFRFYRYRHGQRFAPHRDGSFQRTPDEMSWLTFLVYLNGDFEGGHTRFDLASLPEPVSVKPRAGLALAFAHGCLHEGEVVTSGVKYVLRTDVMYRKG